MDRYTEFEVFEISVLSRLSLDLRLKPSANIRRQAARYDRSKPKEKQRAG